MATLAKRVQATSVVHLMYSIPNDLQLNGDPSQTCTGHIGCPPNVQHTHVVAHSHLCYYNQFLVILGVLYASNHPCQSYYVLERSTLTVYSFCGISAIIYSKSRNYVVRYEKKK